jgi:hypothetical protein
MLLDVQKVIGDEVSGAGGEVTAAVSEATTDQ